MTAPQQQKLFDYMKQEHNVILLHTDFVEIENILKSPDPDHLDKFIPYQLCPKCHGQKTVEKPPHISGDTHQWSGIHGQFVCPICGGDGIILMKRNNE